MLKRTGGSNVRSGFYWNLGKWEMATLPRQGGVLPGSADDRYIKVPVLALLLLAPVMGGLYVMFLPFIGFALVFSYVGRKSGVLLRTGFMEVATTLAPRWAPGEAYLAGKRRAKERARNAERKADEKGDERH
jgi:hypothetical protein